MSVRVRTAERDRSRQLDDDLDEALGQTFPASDPFSVGQVTGTEPPSQPTDRGAPRLEVEPSGRRSKAIG